LIVNHWFSVKIIHAIYTLHTIFVKQFYFYFCKSVILLILEFARRWDTKQNKIRINSFKFSHYRVVIAKRASTISYIKGHIVAMRNFAMFRMCIYIYIYIYIKSTLIRVSEYLIFIELGIIVICVYINTVYVFYLYMCTCKKHILCIYMHLCIYVYKHIYIYIYMYVHVCTVSQIVSLRLSLISLFVYTHLL